MLPGTYRSSVMYSTTLYPTLGLIYGITLCCAFVMHFDSMLCKMSMAGDSQHGWEALGILENCDLRAAIHSSFLPDSDEAPYQPRQARIFQMVPKHARGARMSHQVHVT